MEFISPEKNLSSSSFIKALSDILNQLKTEFEICEAQEPVHGKDLAFTKDINVLEQLLRA